MVYPNLYPIFSYDFYFFRQLSGDLLPISMAMVPARPVSGQVVWYGRSIGSGPALRAVHRITQDQHAPAGRCRIVMGNLW